MASRVEDAAAMQRTLTSSSLRASDEGGRRAIGCGGPPARIRFVSLLPKTRSGKLLRRAIQAVCEQRDPGDLTTMDDPSALAQIKSLVAG